MSKRVTAFELILPAREPETPVYRWIYAALRTEILEGRLRGARLIYVTPGLQFPLGIAMSLPRRLHSLNRWQNPML